VRIIAKAACLLIHFPLSAVGPDRHRSRVGGISVLRSPVERVGARSAMYICAGLRTGLAHPSAEGVGVTRTSSGSSSCPDRAGDPEERRDVLSRLESEHDHGGGDLSIPVLESAAEKADQEQGQALGGPGAHEGFGGDSATSTRSVLSLEIPLHEKVAPGQRIESRCSLPMDADGDTGTSPIFTVEWVTEVPHIGRSKPSQHVLAGIASTSNIQDQNAPNELKITSFGRHERMLSKATSKQ